MTVSYTMSVIHKIPALVSALAFGYGLGMAAPDSTISSVQSAVVAYNHVGGGVQRPPAGRPSEALPPPPRASSSGIGGEESRELGKLRDAAQAKEGPRAASCEIDRPRSVVTMLRMARAFDTGISTTASRRRPSSWRRRQQHASRATTSSGIWISSPTLSGPAIYECR